MESECNLHKFKSSELIKELVKRGDLPFLSDNESVKSIMADYPKIFCLLTNLSHDETDLIRWCEPLYDVLPEVFVEKMENLL